MLVKKIYCDRCKCEIVGDEHPPRIMLQNYYKSEKIAVQSAYKIVKKIHLCEDCQKDFEEFMKNES